MALWCLEVVPVGYARIVRARSSSGGNSCLKWCNTHAHGNDENKHDEVTFQLAAVDLKSTLMTWNRCDRHRILKDNIWMCILHQCHNASGLKACTARGIMQ